MHTLHTCQQIKKGFLTIGRVCDNAESSNESRNTRFSVYMYTHLLIFNFQLSSLDNTFEVKLLKNSSGLGFSFSREDNLIPEQINASIVRVKKLFPGQPAAESGKIDVGDVILKVNGAPLKGLSQQVSRDLGREQ